MYFFLIIANALIYSFLHFFCSHRVFPSRIRSFTVALNPKGKNTNAEEIPVYIPERLNEMMLNLKVYLENTSVVLYETRNLIVIY